uniref:Uncharacterized protein n=1 Tax=Zea mays TaxID=4577 RepID=A0A804UEN7_MAIZE
MYVYTRRRPLNHASLFRSRCRRCRDPCSEPAARSRSRLICLSLCASYVHAGVPADRGHVVRDGDVRVPAGPERADEPGRAGEQDQPAERRAGQRRRGPALQPARLPPLPRHAAPGGLPRPQQLLLRLQ